MAAALSRLAVILCRDLVYPAQGSAFSDESRFGRLATVKASAGGAVSSSSQASGVDTGAAGLARVD